MPDPLKKQILDSIAGLPEDMDDIEEVMYRLYVLDKVRKAQIASQEGRVVSIDDLQQEMDSW